MLKNAYCKRWTCNLQGMLYQPIPLAPRLSNHLVQIHSRNMLPTVHPYDLSGSAPNYLNLLVWCWEKVPKDILPNTVWLVIMIQSVKPPPTRQKNPRSNVWWCFSFEKNNLGRKSDMVPGANVESMQRVRPRYRLLQRFCFVFFASRPSWESEHGCFQK